MDLKNINFDLSDLKNLDANNIGSWPLAARVAAIVLLSAATLAAGYYFDTQQKLQELDGARALEPTLKQEFESKQAKAVHLDAYKQQMQEMEESFGTMLRQLPSKTEVAELLVDITQTGLASGLEFDLFRPQSEQPREFYAELPITLKVLGNYHEFGAFVSGVAALPRIVTIHDINIGRAAGDAKSAAGEPPALAMQAVAKTYRYLDEQEMPKPGKKQ